MSEESQPNLGPSREVLRHLQSMLPSAAKGIVEKKIAKNRPAPPAEARPTKYCEVCVKLFERKFKHEGGVESAVCADCQALLDQGYIAFTTADRYAFGKSEALKDMAGKIVFIQESTMNKMVEKFKVEQKGKPNPENN